MLRAKTVLRDGKQPPHPRALDPPDGVNGVFQTLGAGDLAALIDVADQDRGDIDLPTTPNEVEQRVIRRERAARNSVALYRVDDDHLGPVQRLAAVEVEEVRKIRQPLHPCRGPDPLDDRDGMSAARHPDQPLPMTIFAFLSQRRDGDDSGTRQTECDL
jgi:hypothetical protein